MSSKSISRFQGRKGTKGRRVRAIDVCMRACLYLLWWWSSSILPICFSPSPPTTTCNTSHTRIHPRPPSPYTIHSHPQFEFCLFPTVFFLPELGGREGGGYFQEKKGIRGEASETVRGGLSASGAEWRAGTSNCSDTFIPKYSMCGDGE
jgi:hypothetical protein